MSWRDNLRDATFRGIPFLASSHDTSGGRRLELHEYPLRDDPFAEDLGKKAKRFSLECYVIGPDYMPARDSLEEALDAEGPGALVIPWRGTVQVAVDDYRLRESDKEGGMARFTVQFVLAGQASEPSTMPDTAALVDQAAQNADVAVVDDFSEVFTTASVSEWLRTSAIGSVRDVISQARQVTDLAALPVSSVALFAASAESLEAEITSLVGLPSSLAERLLELLGSLLPDVSDTSGGWPAQAALAVLSVPATLSELSLSATANRVLEATNAAAIADLVSRASVINAARNSASLEFESYDQAVTVRSELVEALDVAASSAPDPVFRTLTDLRVAVVRDITARGANLARLTTWTPQATLPSLVVAHKIYGDASRATEIVSRNRVRHPGAVPGGQTLEVLTNA